MTTVGQLLEELGKYPKDMLLVYEHDDEFYKVDGRVRIRIAKSLKGYHLDIVNEDEEEQNNGGTKVLQIN